VKRRAKPQPTTPAGVPTDLAAGPCVEMWASPGAAFPEASALHNWQDARDAWATSHGLDPASDYRHLPPELYDRAPYSRRRDQR
jgi:hypothetical protein